MDRGILYIATGDFIFEAIRSAKQVGSHMQEVPIAVVTDREIDIDCFDKIIHCDDPKYGWADKPNHIRPNYFNKTIYFDSDIYIVENICGVFNLLDEFDIALAHEPARVTHKIEEVPNCFPEYNTGVFAFKNNEKVKAVLNDWRRIYDEREEDTDQPAFRKAVFDNDVDVAVLPCEYNCRWPLAGHVNGTVKVFHGRLEETDKESLGIQTDENVDKVVEKINGTENPRVFVNSNGDLNVFEWDPIHII